MSSRKTICTKFIFKNFYTKNREIILYLLFGGLTFLVSIVTYLFFNITLAISELIANILSWILSVTFAFLTNKVWVFHAPVHAWRDLIKQLFSFFCGRLATLAIEEVILFVFITILEFNSMKVKIIAQIIVIIINYMISKLFVFRQYVQVDSIKHKIKNHSHKEF